MELPLPDCNATASTPQGPSNNLVPAETNIIVSHIRPVKDQNVLKMVRIIKFVMELTAWNGLEYALSIHMMMWNVCINRKTLSSLCCDNLTNSGFNLVPFKIYFCTFSTSLLQCACCCFWPAGVHPRVLLASTPLSPLPSRSIVDNIQWILSLMYSSDRSFVRCTNCLTRQQITYCK